LFETLVVNFRLYQKRKTRQKKTTETFGIEETEMTKAELEKFKTILETKQKELSGSLRNRDEIVIEKAPDALDEVQLAGERELAIRNLDRDSNMLRQIRRALARIADGSYGVCLHCEEDISMKRMNAVPWAAFCIKCQEQVDRHEIEVEDSADLFASAA
jgi:DnaK suppressor protein